VNYFFTRDHLGSVREVIDTSGVMQARYDYDPYERMTVIAGSFIADFGYAGMYYHPASGLNLTLYRAYDSDLGRWLNRDPIGELGGLNLYGYVGNEPINRIDPYGELAIGAAIGFFVGVASGAAGALATGGSWDEVAYGALAGGVGGFLLGAIDPSEGILTIAALSAVAGGLGDAASQEYSIAKDPCKKFNEAELAWAIAGGAIGGAGGYVLTDSSTGIGEFGSNLFGTIFGSGPGIVLPALGSKSGDE
jgi:RHS repeat-associated protein